MPSSVIPPWPCTRPFGSPVVPEVNSTHSGCENSTCSKHRLDVVAHQVVPRARPPPVRRGPRRRTGTCTVARRVGSAERSCATTSPRSTVLAVPVVAVGGDQHDRFELGEPADRAVGAEVGGAARPHRPDRGGSEAADHGVLGVGQVRRHPVSPGRTPARAARRRGPRPGGAGRRRELAGGRCALPDADQRGRVVGAAAQRVLGPVQPGAGEPPGVRHRVVRAHLLPGRREPHVEVVDDRVQNRSRSCTDHAHSASWSANGRPSRSCSQSRYARSADRSMRSGEGRHRTSSSPVPSLAMSRRYGAPRRVGRVGDRR